MRSSAVALLLGALLAVPSAAHAIQLHWSSGATNLTLTEARACTLVVASDAGEQGLPQEWRVLWVSSGCGIGVAASDEQIAGGSGSANVCGITPPRSAVTMSSNETTVNYCSADDQASVGQVVLAVSGPGHATLQVVAVDRVDPTRVIRSERVHINGGVDGPLPPVILTTTRSRSGSTVVIEAVGTGLHQAQSALTLAPDSSWAVAMDVVGQTDTTLSTSAEIPAMLPASVFAVDVGGGVAASEPVVADEVVYPEEALSTAYIAYHDSTDFRPKDFSIIYDGAQRRFHLFFMRQDASNGDAIYSGKKIVHVWSDNLLNWSSQDSSFSVGTGWDGLSLWAPYVFQVGNLYYMYYTGVDNLTNRNQRIGCATTTDLNVPGSSWSRSPSYVFDVYASNWADPPSANQQMRDPFVIRDPADTTHFLLFYSATTHPDTGAIGVALSSGTTPTNWGDLGMIRYAHYDYSFTPKAESPMAFMHINSSHTPPDTSWYLMFTGYWADAFAFDVNAHTPADRSTVYGPNNWVLVNKRVGTWTGYHHEVCKRLKAT